MPIIFSLVVSINASCASLSTAEEMVKESKKLNIISMTAGIFILAA